MMELMMSETKVVESDEIPAEVSIASSVIPYDRDDEKALYFGYRSCGFSLKEALSLIDRSKTWLSLARRDPQFVQLEGRIPEFREQLSKEYVEIEFFRNFRLALEKDYRVLMRSLGLERNSDNKVVAMTSEDQAYLLKMRSQYNPQQLGMLETIVKGGGEGYNFAEWVAKHQNDIIQFSQTRTVTVKKGHNE
jgi:hypothetical protein